VLSRLIDRDYETLRDAEKLTGWLAANVAHAERDADRVRVELLKRMREERIEPPADGRAGRMVASALRTAELAWFAAIPSRLDGVAASSSEKTTIRITAR
jgi:hypothetical protein